MTLNFDAEAWPWAARFHPLDEGRLHYVDEGSGSAVLLAHGTPTWAFEWRHVVRDLARDHRVLAVDHLGFGRSDRPADADYRVQAHADRFGRFADGLGLEDVTVVLHDYGGPIGLDWVLDHPGRVRRLVLVNTFGWDVSDQARFAWPSALFRTAFGRWLYRRWNVSQRVLAASAWADRSAWTAVAPNYLSAFEEPADRERVLWPLSCAFLDEADWLGGLEARMERLSGVPVDVIWGAADPAFTAVDRDRWASLLPHARVRTLERAGHWPHEERPEAFLAALRTPTGSGCDM